MKHLTLTCLTLTLFGHVVGAKRKSRSNRERSKRNLIPYLESTDGVAPEGSREYFSSLSSTFIINYSSGILTPTLVIGLCEDHRPSRAVKLIFRKIYKRFARRKFFFDEMSAHRTRFQNDRREFLARQTSYFLFNLIKNSL